MDQQLKELTAEIEELKRRVAYLEQQAGAAADPGGKPLTKRPFSARTEWPAVAKRKRPAPVEPDGPEWPPEIISGRKPQAKHKEAFELSEVKLAGTWFNRLGILAIMIAVAFFLKWSFDNHLIGELGRIVIGIVIGTGFLGAGEYFQRRKYSIYGQGFTGGGIAILYFSIFAAFVFYHLISQPAAFGLMVMITLAASLLAVRYDSVAVGIIGLVGGFATPFLLSDGQSSKVILYTYFAILDAGVLLIAYFKKWPLFNYLTFIFTFGAFPAGFAAGASSYLRSFDAVSFAYLTLFFVIYLGISFLWNIRIKAGFLWADVSLILLNAAAYFAFSYVLLNPHIKDWIGFWAIGLGLIYLLLGLYCYRRYSGTQKLSLTLLAIAAGFVTLAIPLQVDGYWVSMAWAMEAVILFYLSFKVRPDKVPLPGFIVLFLAVFSLLGEPFRITGQEAWIFLNRGAVAYLVVILAMAFIIRLYYQETKDKPKLRKNYLFFGLQVALNLMIILFLTLETDAYYDYRRSLMQQETLAFLNSKALVLSLLWGLHAAALVVLGFWRRLKGIRWFGLGFLGLVILKVFLFDLSNLSMPNRILSFMALGIILLAVSWLYLRYKNQIIGGNEDEDQVNL